MNWPNTQIEGIGDEVFDALHNANHGPMPAKIIEVATTEAAANWQYYPIHGLFKNVSNAYNSKFDGSAVWAAHDEYGLF